MTVRRVVRSGDPAIAAIGRIYESSIPATERKPTAWIVEVATRSDFSVLVAEAHGLALGFATVFVPAESTALLEYLAVDNDYRGVGIGSLLFDAVATIAANRSLLIEVDRPTDAVSRQRIAFYQRCGCRLIEGVDYVLPLPTNPPVMRLMMFPSSSKITPERMRQSLEQIYVRVYAQAADDRRIDQMIDAFSSVG